MNSVKKEHITRGGRLSAGASVGKTAPGPRAFLPWGPLRAAAAARFTL